MPHFVSTKDKIVQNMDDIASDFACLKVSALKKASRISGKVDRITIGPDSTINESESENSENIENEQNSCNITVPQKSIHSQSKISMQNGIPFSFKKILLESEYQRKEEVQKEIERHWQHMKENGKAIQEHIAISRSHMARERERKSKENYAYILAEERIAEQEEIHRRHERQKEVEEYRKKIKETEELTKKIIILRNVYAVNYHDIIALSENCKDKNSFAILLSSYAEKFEELHQQMKLIDEKIKTGEITSVDLNIVVKVVYQSEEMLCVFRSEVDRINAQCDVNLSETKNTIHSHAQVEDSQGQEIKSSETVCETIIPEQVSISNMQNNDVQECRDEEKQQNLQTENITTSNISQVTFPIINIKENVSTTESEKDHLDGYVDKELLQIYVNSQKFLEDYVKSFDEFLQSPTEKSFRFEIQKAINIPVNTISGINEQHLRDKYERLHNLLKGTCWPNVKQHPQGTAYCKNILAKKIVSQGETLISSKPKMAFPIAAVIVALWNDHSDFGDLLLSHFHNVCPFTVPVFMPKIVGQSNEDYYKLMGYKYAEDGTIEKHDKFLRRMSGLMRLYASITITTQRKGVNKSNPHGLQNAWRWLAAILNIEPRKEVSDLCATLLLDMFEVAGSTLWVAYPKQFHKLLILLSEEYYPRMQNVGCIGGGPLARLEEFLRNSLAKGSIAPPEGQLPPDFW
ncbi:PREDICTED: nucleoporin GLE1 [Eufriesea mexicana]|uniref:nucleoporin GLE1 n=1 Tax=Eufriesea mexicana TaxID=516756 RepID=UPI00083C49BF|nr:PREDICTED: nucleoporin GLE1 [Eufriesea mexicana]